MRHKLALLVGGARRWYVSARASRNIGRYLASGRKPWTLGYNEYKERVIRAALRDEGLRRRFVTNGHLPPRYGFRLDERVVEYQWVLARLDTSERLLLDAGSTLTYGYLLDHPSLTCRGVVVYNLSPESVVGRGNVSYIQGDLRRTILRSECFDEIVCISTLEHIGMDNTFLYSKHARHKESRPDDYKVVVREFKRLLKPGGKAMITVPYGVYEDHGWLQQFDSQRVETVLDVFGGSASAVCYYRYVDDGWQVSDAETCSDGRYFDVHNRQDYEPDCVAAARAVACIELVK